MKKLTRAAATALLSLSVAAVGLSLPMAGAAVAGSCDTCWGDSAPADPGPAWEGQSVHAGDCAGCWPNEVIAPTGWNGDYGHA